MDSQRHVQFALGRNTYHSPPNQANHPSPTSSAQTSSSASTPTFFVASHPMPLTAHASRPKPTVLHLATPCPIIIQFPSAPIPAPAPAPHLPSGDPLSRVAHSLTRVAHPLLRYTPRHAPPLAYDLRTPPETARVSSYTHTVDTSLRGLVARHDRAAFHEPATLTPCSALTLTSPHFPWVLDVPATAGYVTVLDVLRALHTALQQPASRAEYRAWLPTRRLRRQAARAYEARCAMGEAGTRLGLDDLLRRITPGATSERAQGLKRVDFLPNFRFQGLEPVPDDPEHMWWLHVY
ncbi:hypothetical protein HDZ31DRAFT_36673 [Schizophyllum fasciatum]